MVCGSLLTYFLIEGPNIFGRSYKEAVSYITDNGSYTDSEFSGIFSVKKEFQVSELRRCKIEIVEKRDLLKEKDSVYSVLEVNLEDIDVSSLTTYRKRVSFDLHIGKFFDFEVYYSHEPDGMKTCLADSDEIVEYEGHAMCYIINNSRRGWLPAIKADRQMNALKKAIEACGGYPDHFR